MSLQQSSNPQSGSSNANTTAISTGTNLAHTYTFIDEMSARTNGSLAWFNAHKAAYKVVKASEDRSECVKNNPEAPGKGWKSVKQVQAESEFEKLFNDPISSNDFWTNSLDKAKWMLDFPATKEPLIPEKLVRANRRKLESVPYAVNDWLSTNASPQIRRAEPDSHVAGSDTVSAFEF